MRKPNRKPSTRPSRKGARSSEHIIALNAAFNFLYGGLRDARKQFETGDNGGREGAIHAVEILLKFLSRFQPVLDEGLNAPLISLFNALLSLDDGTVEPLLKPVPARGRSRASAIRDSLKGAAAFTVMRLRAAGQRAPDAYRDVARVCHDAGVKAARGQYPKITRRTVRGWCAEVAADVGRRGEAAQALKLLEADNAENAEATDKRPYYLDKLAKLIRKLRASDQ
jgi:hypothetical protein